MFLLLSVVSHKVIYYRYSCPCFLRHNKHNQKTNSFIYIHLLLKSTEPTNSVTRERLQIHLKCNLS